MDFLRFFDTIPLVVIVGIVVGPIMLVAAIVTMMLILLVLLHSFLGVL